MFDSLHEDRKVVKISDFGLATVKVETRSRTASPALGSELWMAPELFGDAPHTEKSDVFSFGLVLFEIAAVDVSYRGWKRTPQIMKRKRNMKDPCPVPEDFPSALLQLMRKCIDPNQQGRPTMSEVFNQLHAIRGKVSTKVLINLFGCISRSTLMKEVRFLCVDSAT